MRITQREAMVMHHVDQAMRGDLEAFALLLELESATRRHCSLAASASSWVRRWAFSFRIVPDSRLGRDPGRALETGLRAGVAKSRAMADSRSGAWGSLVCVWGGEDIAELPDGCSR